MTFLEFYFVDDRLKEEVLSAFGKRLQRIRLEKGYTQERLASECELETMTISKIERGLFNSRFTVLHTICKVLKISANELFED